MKTQFKPNETIVLLRRHYKNKLWRSCEEQKEKWLNLLNDLCSLHEVEPARLEIDNKIDTPYYDTQTDRIVLNKYSVISLLHEFIHHLGYFNEYEVFNLSSKTFFDSYKPAKKTLVMDARGYFIKKESGEVSKC